MQYNPYVYILGMALISFVIRALPLTLISKPIRSRLIRSFLHYVPYVTLAVMTFPAILQATEHTWAGAAALIIGLVMAWFGAGLFPVAVSCCLVVFIMERFL